MIMPSPNKAVTLDQQRARHAWERVVQMTGKPDKDKKEFGTQVKKLPTRILASGLGQALAFLEAKKYAPDLLDALSDWMHQRRPAPSERRLVVRIIEGDADFLRFATAECLAYVQWLVRFADAQGLTENTEN
jgi:CRISPR-associated protein Cmr5